MKTTRLRTVAMAILASAGVACAPSGGSRAPIQKAAKSAESNGAQKTGLAAQCAATAQPGKIEKVSIENGNKICVWMAEEISADETRAAAQSEFAVGQHYKAVDIDLRADVSVAELVTADKAGDKSRPTKRARSFKTEMNVLLEFPDMVTEDEAKRVRTYIAQTCAPKITSLWADHIPSLRTEIRFYLANEAEGREINQALELIPSPEVEVDALKRPQLALAFWPFHSQLAALGTPSCDKACEAETDILKVRNCRSSCIEKASEPFCQSLAKLSGHWMGLKDPMVEKECQLKAGEAHPAVVSKSITGGYRKTAQTPTVSDAVEGEQTASAKAITGEDFWKASKIEVEKGMSQILGPVCIQAKR